MKTRKIPSLSTTACTVFPWGSFKVLEGGSKFGHKAQIPGKWGNWKSYQGLNIVDGLGFGGFTWFWVHRLEEETKIIWPSEFVRDCRAVKVAQYFGQNLLKSKFDPPKILLSFKKDLFH